MIKRILFATDFSPHSDRAQAWTLDLAKATGASVDVLHAIEPIPADEDHSFDTFYLHLETKANHRLAQIAEIFHGAGVPCSTKTVIETRWRAITERAQADKADLIVLGSRGHSPKEPRAGTTSHRVFLTTQIPLLIVPRPTS